MEEAKNGNKDKLESLYQKAKALNITNQVINIQDEQGQSAILLAILNNKIDAAKFIIHLGANVNTATNEKNIYYGIELEGNTPLIQASYRGYLSMVETLIQSGANVSISRKSGSHAASMAALSNHLDALKILIHAEPDVADQRGWNGQTPLVAAAKNGHLDVVKYLTSLTQINLDVQDDDGYTALILATYNNHPNVVQWLMEKGASSSIVNNYGENALHWARTKNYTTVIQLLMN